jgi:hypothetical protein
LARAIASPGALDKQRVYWQNAFDGFRPSIVEPTIVQTTVSRSYGSGRGLQQRAQVPLMIVFGALQILLATRQHASRKVRGFLVDMIAAANACLSAFALARMLGPSRSLPSVVHPIPSHKATRMYDLVFGLSALQTRAMERNLPLHMVLLACWAKTQAKCSDANRHEVVFGLIHSGRGLDGVEDIGAPCINMLPVYVRNVLQYDAFVVAKALQADLKSRSAVVEQSRLRDVSSWVGAPGKPLFHYLVNILMVPSSAMSGEPSTGILERIKVSTCHSIKC